MKGASWKDSSHSQARMGSFTNVDSVVGHHVLVVVESMLKITALVLVTKKPLQNNNLNKISTWGFHNLIFEYWKMRNVQKFTQNHSFHPTYLENCADSRTTSIEQLSCCMQSDLREVTKLKVRGWVFFQKLISRRTLIPLSTAASLITSSIGDQYLMMPPL